MQRGLPTRPHAIQTMQRCTEAMLSSQVDIFMVVCERSYTCRLSRILRDISMATSAMTRDWATRWAGRLGNRYRHDYALMDRLCGA